MVLLALAPASAAADDCVCVAPPTELHAADDDGPRVLQSVEVGPFFSSDGAELSSDLPPQVRQRVPLERGDVQWCVSADDPRCSPRDRAPNDGPTAVEGAHVASGLAPPPRLGPGAAQRRPARALDDGARDGARDRLERPPRS